MRKMRVATAIVLTMGCLRPALGALTQTLPAGVRSPALRSGVISGLDQTYTEGGRLRRLGDTRSLSFDAATLSRVNPDAQTLIRVLNAFGSQNLGKDINLGTLVIDTRPEIHYLAPVLAYGVSDRWTLGLGVPLIHYVNRIDLRSVPANLDFYRSQFSGLSSELDRALNVDLVAEARKTLALKGYRNLENRDENFVGDLQLVSLHRWEVDARPLIHQVTLTLPTGPHFDADDLMGLNLYGRTSIENSLTTTFAMAPRWSLVPSASLLLPLPDQIVARVPTDEADNLPEAKTSVARWLGPTVGVSVELHWNFDRRWTALGGLESSWKSADRYDGDGRTDLLGHDTATKAHRVRGGFTYSTVASYQNKESSLPAMTSMEISDTVAGLNVERQLRTEFNLTLFF